METFYFDGKQDPKEWVRHNKPPSLLTAISCLFHVKLDDPIVCYHFISRSKNSAPPKVYFAINKKLIANTKVFVLLMVCWSGRSCRKLFVDAEYFHVIKI